MHIRTRLAAPSKIIAMAVIASSLAACAGKPPVGNRNQSTPIEMWGNSDPANAQGTPESNAAQMMFFVKAGSLKANLKKLGGAYDYENIYWDSPLNKKKWDCKIATNFWLKGDGFISMSSQLLSPYSLRLMIHKADRSLVVQSTTESNPCYGD